MIPLLDRLWFWLVERLRPVILPLAFLQWMGCIALSFALDGMAGWFFAGCACILGFAFVALVQQERGL